MLARLNKLISAKRVPKRSFLPTHCAGCGVNTSKKGVNAPFSVPNYPFCLPEEYFLPSSSSRRSKPEGSFTGTTLRAADIRDPAITLQMTTTSLDSRLRGNDNKKTAALQDGRST
jgi:hypothetical protein